MYILLLIKAHSHGNDRAKTHRHPSSALKGPKIVFFSLHGGCLKIVCTSAYTRMSYIYVSFLSAHGKLMSAIVLQYATFWNAPRKEQRDLYTQHWLRARHYIHMLQHSFFWSFLLITNANETDAYTTWILFPGGNEETQARRNTSEKREEKGEGDVEEGWGAGQTYYSWVTTANAFWSSSLLNTGGLRVQ